MHLRNLVASALVLGQVGAGLEAWDAPQANTPANPLASTPREMQDIFDLLTDVVYVAPTESQQGIIDRSFNLFRD